LRLEQCLVRHARGHRDILSYDSADQPGDQFRLRLHAGRG
jgi:hypothetical protein